MAQIDDPLPERKATNVALDRERERADDFAERPVVSKEHAADLVRNERLVADEATLVERARHDCQIAVLIEQQRELTQALVVQREAAVMAQRGQADELIDQQRKRADDLLDSEGSAPEPLTRERESTDERLQDERAKSDATSSCERQAREEAEQLLDGAVEFLLGSDGARASAA
ncbi:MAG: hypothetical protein ACAI25_01775 [Planctomycetota bacterium]